MRRLVPCLLVLCLGCGRAEYARRMEETRERLSYLDRENELLGAPADDMKEPRVFLRLPKGVNATPEPTKAGEWLRRYASAENLHSMATLEVLVGNLTRSFRRAELEAEIRRALQTRSSDFKPLTDVDKELVVERACDLPRDRRPVKFSRLVYEGVERVAKQEYPLVVRRYDVYVHQWEEWWIVVAFCQLDRDGTERRWRAMPNFDVAWLKRLPVLDGQRLTQQKTYSLATLRVGEEALRRWTYFSKNDEAQITKE